MLVDWGIFMGVLNLPFKVVPIEKKDLLEINKILIKEIGMPERSAYLFSLCKWRNYESF